MTSAALASPSERDRLKLFDRRLASAAISVTAHTQRRRANRAAGKFLTTEEIVVTRRTRKKEGGPLPCR